ncbi:MAG: hypothetical protein U0992_24400 [Planctomycetaceae bacterium]
MLASSSGVRTAAKTVVGTLICRRNSFAEPVLRRVQNFACGTDQSELRCAFRRSDGDVFELECDDSDLLREPGDGVEVVVGGADFDVGDLASRGIAVRRKSMDAVAHLAGGDGEHPPQLSAAEDPQHRSRKDCLAHGNWSFSTASVCWR